MDRGLQFIQSCVRRDINTDDIGYMTKWYINNSEDLSKFFKMVEEGCESKFYDQPNKIKEILKSYLPLKTDSLLERRKMMRREATNIFELTKGFTSEPTDNAMKSALEMAGYVLELTN